MNHRQAKKIVKNQSIYCASTFGATDPIRTAGFLSYPEQRYRKALKILLRKMGRELSERTPGCIKRMGQINSQINWARVERFT